MLCHFYYTIITTAVQIVKCEVFQLGFFFPWNLAFLILLSKQKFGPHEGWCTEATSGDSSPHGHIHLPALLLFWFLQSGWRAIKIFTFKD